jgi:ATP-dependent helicase/nuclease subunit A
VTAARLVSAGAGSGKTWRIVQDVVARVAAGTSLDRIAAVTFTEAAASELQDRIRAGLQLRGLAAEAVRVERASICTIHRFALTLLRRFPLPAALPPDPMVLEPDEAAALFHRALQAALRAEGTELADDDALLVANLVEKARSLGMDGDDLAREAPLAAAWIAGAFSPPLDGAELDANFRAALDEAFDWLDQKTKPRVADEGIRRELRLLRRGVPADLLDAAIRVLGAPRPSKTFAKELPALLPAAEAMALLHPGARGRIDASVQRLFRLGAAAAARYRDEKQRRGALDFEEMQRRALDLLTAPDDRYARAVAAELPYIVVDEFQDTSPLQFRLFEVLRAAGAEVTYVGDLKQAIYGFRGADSSLFSALLTEARASAAPPEVLDRSRRSRPELVRFANALFARVLPRHGIHFDALTADNDYTRPGAPASAGAVELLRVPSSNRHAPRVELGADRIRDLLRAGVPVLDRTTGAFRPARAGDFAVLGRQRAQLAHWGEALRARGIPVLIESDGLFDTLEVRLARAWLAMLASPRDRSASAMVLLSELYGLRQPTVVALSVEKVSGSPRRALELAAREPARLPLSDFEARALERCDADLRACRDALRSLPLGEAVELVLERVALRERLALRCDDAQAAQLSANVAWIVAEAHALGGRRDHALELGGVTGATLENLLMHLDAQAAEQPRQPVALHDDVDAVRLLTLHGSKGLEFPVVLVDLLHAELKVRVPRVDVLRPAYPAALLAADALRHFTVRCIPETGMPPVDALLRERLGDLDEELRESLRLLYVGVTRARDHLLVTWPTAATSSTRYLLRDALAPDLPDLPDADPAGAAATWLDAAVRVFATGDTADAAPPPAAPPVDLDPWRALVDDPTLPCPAVPRAHDPARLARVTPTDLCKVADCPEVLTLGRVHHGEHLMARSEGAEVLRVGVPNAYAARLAIERDHVAPSRVGLLVHAAVSRAGLLAPSAYDASDEQLADAVLTQHDQVEHRAALSLLIVDTLVSLRACVNTLRAVAEPAREVPFVLDLRGTTLYGVVDLVVRAGDGLHVIDLKTHPLRSADLPRWAGYYRPQLDAYALALHRLTGMPVLGRHLAIPAAGTLLTLTDPFDPAATYESLADLADRIARGDRGPARDCARCGWKAHCATGQRHLRAAAAPPPVSSRAGGA